MKEIYACPCILDASILRVELLRVSLWIGLFKKAVHIERPNKTKGALRLFRSFVYTLAMSVKVCPSEKNV